MRAIKKTKIYITRRGLNAQFSQSLYKRPREPIIAVEQMDKTIDIKKQRYNNRVKSLWFGRASKSGINYFLIKERRKKFTFQKNLTRVFPLSV